ncbi:MAG: MFS transporter [Hyphomicrobiaceae bacterium]|nr:MFS transporter [Hyphomicrobiaceae bacterium]
MSSDKDDENGPVWRDGRAIALLAAATLTVMANATLSPALAGLADMFSGTPNAPFLIRLLVPAPSLAVVFLAPLVGLAADRFGRKRLLLTGIALFSLAGSAGFYLPDPLSILISRLVLGVAVALIMVTQTALLGDLYVGERRKLLNGLQTSARNFGGLVFISLSGLVAAISPRFSFGVYALSALVLPLVIAFVREPKHLSGGNLAAAGTENRDGPAPAVSWVWPLAGLVILQMLTNVSFFVMPTQVPFLYAAHGENSAIMTGMTLGLLSLTGGLTALVFARVSGRIGPVFVFALGFGALAMGLLLVGGSGGGPWVFGGAILVGAGYAMLLPNLVALTLGIAPIARRGTASGILTAAVFLGQFASPFVSQPLLEQAGFAGMFATFASVLGLVATGAFGAGLMFRRTLRAKSASGA